MEYLSDSSNRAQARHSSSQTQFNHNRDTTMKFYSGEIFNHNCSNSKVKTSILYTPVGSILKFVLLVTVCCLLLGAVPSSANPLPGKQSQTVASKSKDKKASAPRHSLGTAARMGMTGGGVVGAILTNI
uniref:Uncharacterized protein n=1 Tax=Anopheles epiroticus TaxID=199890 RepID=A0A182PTP2_9DIPT